MPGFFKRWKARLEPIFQDDTAFVEAAFEQILGRKVDLDGLNHYRRVLRQGVGRTAVLLDLMRSDEFRAKLTETPRPLANLRLKRPDAYRHATDRTNGETIPVFQAASAGDFDWLEREIIDNAYYEGPGVWNFGVDADKRVVAEMIEAFAPVRALELGCAAGAVLECLHRKGIHAEGVELSRHAIAKASSSITTRIHRGDLLSLDLERGAYDLVFGLDIFEHLNPNKLDAYISRIRQLTSDDAYLFCNIPAFGVDRVFGTVFPLYLSEWETEATAGRPFSTLHVDELGYPIHGHLIWAGSTWWTTRFESHGFSRDIEVERALHGKYDQYMEARAPARRSYFVFRKGGSAARSEAIARSIRATESATLSEYRAT